MEFARSSRARSYSERTERFFLGLAARGWGFRDHLRCSGVMDDTYFRDQCFVASRAELADDRDIISFLQLLLDEGLMVVTGGNHRLSSKGFQRLEAAERNSRASAQGFVAMWFDPGLDEVYDEGFAERIRRAGFAPLRIDKKEHNNKIDDEIIAAIKRSKFIVADFTCGRVSDADGKEHWLQRGGVLRPRHSSDLDVPQGRRERDALRHPPVRSHPVG